MRAPVWISIRCRLASVPRRMVLASLASVALLCLGPPAAVAQVTQPTPTSPSPTPSSTGGVFENLDANFLSIFALVLLVALTWSVLLFYDLLMSYRVRQRMWRDLLSKLGDQLDREQMNDVGKFLSEAPHGVTGLARTTIALTVATIVSVTLILLLIGGQPEDRELVKTIVTALVAALTTIVGFYFGARTASEGAKEAAESLVRAGQAITEGTGKG